VAKKIFKPEPKVEQECTTFAGRKITVVDKGYRRTFTDEEFKKIERLRKEMRERLFRPG
jgi:hypothetical protein